MLSPFVYSTLHSIYAITRSRFTPPSLMSVMSYWDMYPCLLIPHLRIFPKRSALLLWALVTRILKSSLRYVLCVRKFSNLCIPTVLLVYCRIRPVQTRGWIKGIWCWTPFLFWRTRGSVYYSEFHNFFFCAEIILLSLASSIASLESLSAEILIPLLHVLWSILSPSTSQPIL